MVKDAMHYTTFHLHPFHANPTMTNARAGHWTLIQPHIVRSRCSVVAMPPYIWFPIPLNLARSAVRTSDVD
jgi:hypothetical protein